MNNSYLLDTHCLIWFQENSPMIPFRVMNILQVTSNTIFFSQISLFEIVIKQKIGKIPQFTASIQEVSNQALYDGFTFLPFTNQHIFHYSNIPLFERHRDSFDRLLLATSLSDDLVLLSADSNFNLYTELKKVLW